MNVDNRFDFLVDVVFVMCPHLGWLGTKSQDLVISFCLGEGGTVLQIKLIDIQEIGEMFLLNDKTWQIKNITGKFITELTKLKHIKFYMTTFGLHHGKFQINPQIHQLSTTVQFKI